MNGAEFRRSVTKADHSEGRGAEVRMRLADLKARALSVVRDRGRQVLMTDPGQGLGNLLYLYLHAWGDRARGVETVVLGSHRSDEWLDAFPSLRELTLQRDALRFTDGRDFEAYQGFGTEFSARELDEFCTALLADSRLEVPTYDQDTVTVSVRRGDYYSDPQWRRLYAIDTVGYVREALAVAAAQRPFGAVRLVSDDRSWCRDNLVSVLGESTRVILEDRASSAQRDLAELVGSRRLVLANSTFSYWAGFLSNTVHRDNHAMTVAPWFHRRDINGGASWHLDPRWSVVRDLDGWRAV